MITSDLNPSIKWIGMLALFVIGMTIGWWINQPPPPWMEFTKLEAYYKIGTRQITTDGQYMVRRLCVQRAGQSPNVIWRYEAIATDGQIALYGPKPPAPSFTRGQHRYTGAIPLLQAINPDGWVVRILLTCPGEMPETVTSPPATVQVRR